MRDRRVTVIEIAVAPCHGVSGGGKGMGNKRCRWNASLLEDCTVGHTGRTARPSITYTGNDDVTLFDQFIDDLVLGRVGEAWLRACDDRGQGVAFFEQFANGSKHGVCVEFSVAQKAEPGPIEGMEP